MTSAREYMEYEGRLRFGQNYPTEALLNIIDKNV